MYFLLASGLLLGKSPAITNNNYNNNCHNNNNNNNNSGLFNRPMRWLFSVELHYIQLK